MEELRFKENRNSIIKGLILSGITILIAIAMLLVGILGQVLYVQILFLGFLLLGMYLVFKFLKNQDTVVVNTKGIKSRINGIGFVEWKYIKDFEILNKSRTTFLVMQLHNDDEFLNTLNTISQKLLKSNIKILGSPIVLPQSEFHEPLEIVKEKIENFKNNL